MKQNSHQATKSFHHEAEMYGLCSVCFFLVHEFIAAFFL